MKKNYAKGILSLCLFCFFIISNVNAHSYNGADIEYTYVSNDSVKIILKAYRPCNGQTYSSQQITITPKASKAFTVNASLVSEKDITPSPTGQCTQCSEPTCNFKFGLQRDIYEVTVDLSNFTDCDFTFSWEICCRTINNNDLHVEAKMNRCLAGYKSSPKLLFEPSYFAPYNTCLNFSFAASGSENDSLVYELTPSLADDGVTFVYPYPLTYDKPFTVKDIAEKCGGFVFDKQSGNLTFTPAKAGELSPIAVKISQYAKDQSGKMVKVGEIRRDFMTNILQNYGNDNAEIIITQYEENICAGEKILFNAYTSDKNTDSTVLKAYFIKNGAKITYSNSKNQSVEFEWTPTKNDIQQSEYHVYLSAHDKVSPYFINVQKSASFKVSGEKPAVKISRIDSGCGKYHFYLTGDTDKIKTMKWLVDGKQISTQKSFNLSVIRNGDYAIKVILNAKGSNCTATYHDTLKHNTFPFQDIFLLKTDTICKGSSFTIKPEYNKGKYKWWPNTNLSNDTAAQPIATPLKTTTYYLNLTDENGCLHKDSFKIFVEDFVVEASNDTMTCAGKFAYLKVKPVKGATYLWQPSADVNDPEAAETFASPLVTTTYIVAVKNALGCVKYDSVTVKIITTNAFAGNDKTICFGDSVLLEATGGYTYRWYNGNNSGISDKQAIWVKPVHDEEFKVIVKDSLGCKGTTDNVFVKVNKLNTSISADAVICPGDTVQLQVTGGNKYLWLADNSLSNLNVGSPKVWPLKTTSYTVHISDTLVKCSETKTVKISVLTDCVLPGDANHDFYVNYKDILYTGAGLGFSGSSRNMQGSDWKAVKSDDWTKVTSGGVNYKHMDAYGEGNIDKNDLSVVHLNYTKSFNYTSKTYTAGANDVTMRINFMKDTFYAGDTVISAVILGNALKPAKDLYGYGFGYNVSNISMFNSGPKLLLGNADFTQQNTVEYSKYNKIAAQYEGAVVRTDKMQANTYGKIALIQLILADTNAFENDEPIPFTINLNEALLIDRNAKEYTAKLQSDTTWLKRKKYKKPDVTIGIKESILNNINIYPNPANTEVIISGYSETDVANVTLTNTLGQIILEQKLQPNQNLKLNVKHFPAGLYMVSVRNENKQTVKKLVISR